MALERLDHVNVNTHRLEVMKAFYSEVLGMPPGPRPNFSFGGAWMYCGGQPAVHLVERARLEPVQGDLRLQHFAFAARDLAGFLQRLEAHGVPYRVGIVDDFEICQINVHDPDGNHIHVDFPVAEAQLLGLQRSAR